MTYVNMEVTVWFAGLPWLCKKSGKNNLVARSRNNQKVSQGHSHEVGGGLNSTSVCEKSGNILSLPTRFDKKFSFSKVMPLIILQMALPARILFCIISRNYNLVPRVLRLFGQRLVARRDSAVLEFYYRRISAAK